jgi:CRISPR-associated protein Cas5d
MQSTEQVLEVWGDLACFTRPELKVERFSYPVITPSAARGIFDAIYCKPNKDPSQAEFRWQVTRVEVLEEPRYIALRRNEVKEKVSVSNVQDWMSGKSAPQPILADGDKSITGMDTKGRTQRQTLALKNVRYRLHARIQPWPGKEALLPALEAQFRRRASQGKCFYQPYFGCREFPAYFELVDPATSPCTPAPYDADLGLMLYDVFDLSRPEDCDSKPCVSLFRARVEAGSMVVPDFDSPEVLKLEGGLN